MRRPGSPLEWEHRRTLAVTRVLEEGDSVQEASEFLGVHPASVRRWIRLFRQKGKKGLKAHQVVGRPCKLTHIQEKIVLRWLNDSPTEYGFLTELWNSARLAQLIEDEFGVRFHPHYLSSWLRRRGFTPQRPERVPRERDPRVIARWLEEQWPVIKKKPKNKALTSS